MEPAEFLRHHPPFDTLGPGAFRLAESALEVAYFARGEVILQRGGPRATHLYVVRKGVVRLERDGQLVQTLEEGEAFAFPSLIGRSSPHVDVTAAEDVLAYRFPAAVFEQLMEEGSFREFFLLDLSGRLRRSAALGAPPLGADLGLPARGLVTRAPVTIARTATVADAARRMRELGVSSILVEGEPTGILTDRDLRSRVLAEGLGPGTPIEGVMSSPVVTLEAGASRFDVLMLMLERRVHHVPLMEGGAITGVLTDTDLLRAQVQSPLALLKRVGSGALAAGSAAAEYAGELTRMVDSLFGAGLEGTHIGRVVSRLNDAYAVALLRAAEQELGPPPAPYAWIVSGSEGRMEQTLLTDQDNALVHADGPPANDAWFEALADRVVRGLVAARFPVCPGGYMATRWRMPLSGWVSRFRGWIARPEPQALLDASSFFDFRVVHGSLDVEPLHDVVRGAARERTFLAQLARTALTFEPPLGAFRHIKLEHGGVDLKKGGLLPIVGLARVVALECGADARGTQERLAAAAAAGVISAEGAATLAEAFRFVLRLRLRDQLQSLRAGREADNVARLEGLTALERSQLKDVFVAVREMQGALRLRFGTDRLG